MTKKVKIRQSQKEGESMTEKSDLKRSFKKYPYAWFYAVMAAIALTIGFLIMDGYITPEKELTLNEVYGFCVVCFGAFLTITANFYYKISKLWQEIERIERDNYLQDLQQEK